MKHTVKAISLVLISSLTTGCYSISNAINPFHQSPSKEALMGERNDNALNGGKKNDDEARAALKEMGSFRPAAAPQPYNPVLQPAVVRLMWVPDRLNRNGDLIPAHYYYLKVLKDRWSLQDAFEINAQLEGPGGKSNGSNLPYAYAKDN